MNVLVILAHQRQGSFCHAITETAIDCLRQDGHTVVLHDLYQERFDPILPDEEIASGSTKNPVVQQHCDELTESAGLLIVHPNWWGQPPAILKGWIDRVFCQGVAYEFAEGGRIVPHLAGKKALVLTTSNTPRELEQQLYGDPLENLWKTCMLGFCGVEDFQRRNFESIVMSTPEQRQEWLDDVRQMVSPHFR